MRTRDLALVFAFIGGLQSAAMPLAHAAKSCPAKAPAAKVTKKSATTSAQTDAFSVLGGMVEAKASMRRNVVMGLFHPEVFTELSRDSRTGGPPSGVMVTTMRSNGKTTLVRATIEAVQAKGGQAIEATGIGLKAADVESLFDNAIMMAKGQEKPGSTPDPKLATPVVLFIDELHRIGSDKQTKSDVANAIIARMELLKQEMETHPEMKRVVVVAATSHPDQVDAGLQRPELFNVQVDVALPTTAERLDTLKVLTAKHKVATGKNAPNFVRLAEENTRSSTYGDIRKLVDHAHERAIARLSPDGDASVLTKAQLAAAELHAADFDDALTKHRPENMAKFGIDVDKVRFDDIVGNREAVAFGRKLLKSMKNPEAAARLGAKPSVITVLAGEAGLGKTMLVKAIATEGGMPIFTLGSDTKSSTYGSTEQNMNAVIAAAEANAPSIIFVDEAETMFEGRDSFAHSGDPVHKSIVGTALATTDGVKTKKQVYWVLATNHPDMLDKALVGKPGEGGRGNVITFHKLDEADRATLFGKLLKPGIVGKDVKPEALAKRTDGWSNRSMAKLIEDAALNAFDRDSNTIDMQDIEKVFRSMDMGQAPSAAGESEGPRAASARRLSF